MSNLGSDNKRIAINTIFLYIRMFVILIVTFYTTRVILQTLGVVDYGIFNVIGGVVSMLSFVNASMANGFQRFLNIELGIGNIEGVKKVFTSSFTVQVLLILIIVLLGETIGVWFLKTQMNIPTDRMNAAYYVFQFALLTFTLSMLQVPFTAVIIAFEDMRFYACICVIEALFKLFAVYILLYSPYDKLIFYSILISIIVFFILLIYVVSCFVKYTFLSIKLSVNKDVISRMLIFSGWNTFGSTAHLLEGQGINILLNIFFGPVVNAARGIAFQVQSGLNSFVTNLHMAARPQIIQSYSNHNMERMWFLTYQISRFSFFLMLLLTLPFFLEAKYILNIWLGEVTEYTVSFTRIVVLTGLFNVFATPITTIVHATGKMRNFQLVCSLVIMSVVPISYFFLKCNYSPNSVMIAGFVITILVQIVRLFLLKTIICFSIWDYCRNVLNPVFKVMIMSFILSFFVYFLVGNNTIIIRFLLIIIYCVILVFCIYSLGLSKNEKLKLKEGLLIRFRKP